MPPKKARAKAAAAAVRKRKLKEEAESSSETESESESESESSQSGTDEPPAKKRRDTAKKGAESESESESGSESEDDAGSRPAAKNGWEKTGSVLMLIGDVSHPRVAAFDMDDCIITVKGTHVHPKSATDWRWICDSAVDKLKAAAKTHNVVIFTNQGGINGKNGWDESKASQIRTKISSLAKESGIALSAFAATTEDVMRKPHVGMWELMEKTFRKRGGVSVDRSKSFYVGDAAGRTITTMAGRKKDFSCSDRKFAHNVSVDFMTPEEFFLGQKPADFSWGDGFSPKDTVFPKEMASGIKPGAKITKPGVEVVLLVGYPGSGKSTFAARHFVSQGYVHVNRDTLKTQPKCLNLLKESLAKGKSVVVDNTNPSAKVRQEYIKAAKAKKAPVRCYWLQASKELANHLNYFREYITNGSHRHVPRIAYNVYKNGFEEPTTDEGFTEVNTIDFVPEFADAGHKTVFNSYLT